MGQPEKAEYDENFTRSAPWGKGNSGVTIRYLARCNSYLVFMTRAQNTLFRNSQVEDQ